MEIVEFGREELESVFNIKKVRHGSNDFVNLFTNSFEGVAFGSGDLCMTELVSLRSEKNARAVLTFFLLAAALLVEISLFGIGGMAGKLDELGLVCVWEVERFFVLRDGKGCLTSGGSSV